MKVGMLTAPFGTESMEEIVDFAAEAGFDCLEIRVPSPHCDLDNVDYTAMQDLVSESGLEISSLAAYVDITNGDPAVRAENQLILSKALDAVEKLDCDCLCCMAGLPAPGKSREQSIKEDAAPFYREFAKKAADKGVKLAMENWFATNIRSLSQWDMIFNEVPAENFGLNFDPSHLHWQGVDPVEFIRAFPDRIYHMHFKDAVTKLNGKTGILASHLNFGDPRRGWDFRSPGRGSVNFEEIIRALNDVGYQGPLSVEWEDSGMDREFGAREACQYVRNINFAPSARAFDAAFEE